MHKNLLTLHSGSLSIKFSLCDVAANVKKELYGKIDRIGLSDTTLTYHDLITGKTGKETVVTASVSQFLIDWLKEYIDISSVSGI